MWSKVKDTPSFSAVLALCKVKPRRELRLQERLIETAIHKDADRQAQPSAVHGLEIPKAPVLVTSSAGYSPTSGRKTRQKVCS